MEDNKIAILDENGKEIEMNILFTVDIDDKNYVMVFEDGDDENVYPLSYDEEGNLYVVEDEDILEKLQEIMDAFSDEEVIDDEEIS